MKVKILIEQLNKALEKIAGVKYEGNEQFKNTIESVIRPVLENTELGNLLKFERDTIRLVKKYESNCFGGGEELISISIEHDRDKRTKYAVKGKFKTGKAIKHKNIDDSLLEFELKDLQSYFNKVNTQNNIRWYNEEIERKRQEILKLEDEKQKEIEKLNDMK